MNNTLNDKTNVGARPSKQVNDNKRNMEFVKDEKSKQVKPVKYSPLIELMETHKKFTETNFNMHIEEFIKEILPSMPEKQPPGKYTLYTFIANSDELMNKYLVPHLKNQAAGSKEEDLAKNNISSLTTRILRFKIRLIALDILINNAHRNPIAIKGKFRFIISSLKCKIVILHFLNTRIIQPV